jgi:site-specific DNA-methyltransferase (adenine-specific)
MQVKEKIGGLFFDLIKGDTLIENEQIEDGSVDLILTDLPYGTIKGQGNSPAAKQWGFKNSEWDLAIDPKIVFEIANRILRKNGKLILFGQEPYISKLLNEAIPNLPFGLKMIWEKDNYGSHLKCNKAPLGYFEEIIIFSKTHDLERSHPLIDYFTGELSNTGMNQSDINKLLGNKMGGHYFTNGVQFCIPTEPNYKKLQETGYFQKPYQELKAIDEQFKKQFASTFNLWGGGKYKSNILKYKKDYNGYHPTQKPVLLLEDLIKTFSNENDLVVDLTMGSGSTGVACKNTNRNFIGIEKDDKYFEIAEKRIKGNEPNPNGFEKAKERGIFSFTDEPDKAD